MTTEQKIIRAKVGLLELAKQLGNTPISPELRAQFIVLDRPAIAAVSFRTTRGVRTNRFTAAPATGEAYDAPKLICAEQGRLCHG